MKFACILLICAPPTLTIVAMAVRVVDAVKQQLGKG